MIPQWAQHKLCNLKDVGAARMADVKDDWETVKEQMSERTENLADFSRFLLNHKYLAVSF